MQVFIYLFMAALVFFALLGLPLVGESGSCSLVAVHGLLIVVASLVAGTGSRHAGFSSCSVQSQQWAHGLSCFTACRILPGEGSDPRPLHWQANSYPLYHQEKFCLL